MSTKTLLRGYHFLRNNAMNLESDPHYQQTTVFFGWWRFFKGDGCFFEWRLFFLPFLKTAIFCPFCWSRYGVFLLKHVKTNNIFKIIKPDASHQVLPKKKPKKRCFPRGRLSEVWRPSPVRESEKLSLVEAHEQLGWWTDGFEEP